MKLTKPQALLLVQTIMLFNTAHLGPSNDFQTNLDELRDELTKFLTGDVEETTPSFLKVSATSCPTISFDTLNDLPQLPATSTAHGFNRLTIWFEDDMLYVTIRGEDDDVIDELLVTHVTRSGKSIKVKTDLSTVEFNVSKFPKEWVENFPVGVEVFIPGDY